MANREDIQNRAAGAIMGAFIGDALGLGPHWYYNLDELRRDYGDWIDDYTDPKPGRYHAGLKAGQLSQAGIILDLMLRSLVESNGYDEDDFCRRLDDDLFPLLDGTPASGPGGYTSQSIRDAWRKRVEHGLPWGEVGGHADTTEAIERTLAIAVRYAFEPRELAAAIADNTVLTQVDETVVSMTVEYGALLTPSFVAAAAGDPDVRIEPPWKVSLVYGMPCAIYHQLPAAYYLSARFADGFEAAVLHAVNGGGQNMARAMLTGALTGAQVGLSGIPQRFIDGLENADELQQRAEQVASAVAQGHSAQQAGETLRLGSRERDRWLEPGL